MISGTWRAAWRSGAKHRRAVANIGHCWRIVAHENKDGGRFWRSETGNAGGSGAESVEMGATSGGGRRRKWPVSVVRGAGVAAGRAVTGICSAAGSYRASRVRRQTGKRAYNGR